MFWALLSIIGAGANALFFIANKKFLQTIGPDALASSGFLISSFFLLIIASLRGIPVLGPEFFFAVAGTSAINIVAITLIFRTLKSTDLSLTVPMLSFTPLFLLVTATLLLGELPSLPGLFGVIIIVAGSYILNTSASDTRLLDPFRSMVSNPGILSMFIVSFMYAFSIGFDKMVVLNSDPVFGSGVVFLVLGCSFLAISLVRRGFVERNRNVLPDNHFRSPGQKDSIVPNLLLAGVVIGVILTIEAIAINSAYILQIAPYVIAIKRMSILLTVMYGTFVIREKEVLRRLAGAILMVGGAILIILYP
jgi:drug/metabolite transporter (DMT)-like permease